MQLPTRTSSSPPAHCQRCRWSAHQARASAATLLALQDLGRHWMLRRGCRWFFGVFAAPGNSWLHACKCGACVRLGNACNTVWQFSTVSCMHWLLPCRLAKAPPPPPPRPSTPKQQKQQHKQQQHHEQHHQNGHEPELPNAGRREKEPANDETQVSMTLIRTPTGQPAANLSRSCDR